MPSLHCSSLRAADPTTRRRATLRPRKRRRLGAARLTTNNGQAARQLGPEFQSPAPRHGLSSIPSILEDESDALIHARTGSGKTLAYLLPLIERIDSSRQAARPVCRRPTRELGLQVAKVLRRLTTGTVMSLLDGSSLKRQRTWAWAEPPHVAVVGNPHH